MAFVEKQETCPGEEILKVIDILVSPSNDGPDVMAKLLTLCEQLVTLFEAVVLQCRNAIITGQRVDNHSQLLQKNMSSLGNAVNTLKCSLSSTKVFNSSVLCHLLDTCFSVNNITFTFCKEVELNHAHMFDSIASAIGPVFKGSFLLLKICSECIELIGVPNEDHTPIIRVVVSLYAVAQTTLKFDPSLILISWKALGKLLCLLKDHVNIFDNSDVSVFSVISGMCDGMITKSKECVKSTVNNNKEGNHHYVKLLKTCRFFATMIIKVVKEYNDYHRELANHLLKFLLDLNKVIPPSLLCSLSFTQSQCSDIDSNLSVVIEPLLISLMNCEKFLRHLITDSADDNSFFPRLLLLCLILKNYQKLNDQSKLFLFEETSSQKASCRLLDCLFSCVKECDVEFSLPVYVPGVIIGGTSPYHVTLYEYLVTHVCSVIAVLPIGSYSIVEKFLLESLLVSNNVYCSLLIQDIWCFIARWGTSVLCYDHVLILIKLLFAVTTDSIIAVNIKTLLKRLIVFTTSSQQRDLLNLYPPNEPNNLLLWACVSTLDSTIQKEVCSTVYISLSTTLMAASATSPLVTYYCVQCFNTLLSEPDLKPHLQMMMSPNVVDKLIKMLNGITSLQDSNNLHLLTACELLQIFSHLLNSLNSDQLARIFKTLRVICAKHDLPGDILVGVAHILANSTCISSTITLGIITDCFTDLLSHTHQWLVLNEVLEAFRQFAETTPLAEILERCIPAVMNNTVVDYLHKVPYNSKGCPELLCQSHISSLLVELSESRNNTACAPPLAENNHTQLIIEKGHTSDNVIVLDENNPIENCRVPVLDLLTQWERVKTMSLLSCEKKKIESVCEEMQLFIKED